MKVKGGWVLPFCVILKDALSPPSVALASEAMIVTDGSAAEEDRRKESNCCCAIAEVSVPPWTVASAISVSIWVIRFALPIFPFRVSDKVFAEEARFHTL